MTVLLPIPSTLLLPPRKRYFPSSRFTFLPGSSFFRFSWNDRNCSRLLPFPLKHGSKETRPLPLPPLSDVKKQGESLSFFFLPPPFHKASSQPLPLFLKGNPFSKLYEAPPPSSFTFKEECVPPSILPHFLPRRVAFSPFSPPKVLLICFFPHPLPLPPPPLLGGKRAHPPSFLPAIGENVISLFFFLDLPVKSAAAFSPPSFFFVQRGTFASFCFKGLPLRLKETIPPFCLSSKERILKE